MKQLINKYSHIALLAFLSIALPTRCSQQPWSDIISGFSYPISVLAVDCATGIRTMINKPIMAINPDTSIKVLKNRLALREKNIREAQQKQIYEIAKEHGLNDTDIKKGLEIINKVNGAYKESHTQPNHDALHDKKISPENFTVLKTTLSEKNIDINNISLINSDIPSADRDIATTEHSFVYSITENNSISSASYSNHKPIKITFYPSFYLHNEQDQQAMCVHEATHIIENHHITQGITPRFIGNIIQKDHNYIRESKSFQKLLLINERQAEILPSIHDKKSALLMRTLRANYRYPGMPYGQHYLELSNIDEAHTIITYLERIKNNPRKPMPAIKDIRFRQFCQNNL